MIWYQIIDIVKLPGPLLPVQKEERLLNNTTMNETINNPAPQEVRYRKIMVDGN
jgi:hypothetical protein